MACRAGLSISRTSRRAATPLALSPSAARCRSERTVTHAAARGDALQLVDPGRRLGHGLYDCQTAEHVECIALAPEVCIGQADAPRNGIDEDFASASRFAPRDGDALEAAAGDAFPTGVAELTSERKGMLAARRASDRLRGVAIGAKARRLSSPAAPARAIDRARRSPPGGHRAAAARARASIRRMRPASRRQRCWQELDVTELAAHRGGGSPSPTVGRLSGQAGVQERRQASAVVGSMIVVTRATLVGGKPPRRACSRTSSSLGAT